MNLYQQLQQKLDAHPVGAPMSEEYMEILRILFPPGEIEVAAFLDFGLTRVDAIAERVGLPAKEAEDRLESMANRGVLLAKRIDGEMAYALLPNYPGLFEYPLCKGQDPDTQDRLMRLWKTYYMKSMVPEFMKADPQWQRVIPVEHTISEEHEVLPYEVASQMLAKSKAIALAECACRITEQKCDGPIDTCLYVNGLAMFLAERGIAKLITLEEAIEVLKKADEAGLVHTGSNNVKDLVCVCNCCPCCCHGLRLVSEFNHAGLAKSSYQASISLEECNGCGLCVERCHFKAIEVSDEAVELNIARCYGCGLCISTCPTGALKLVKRQDYVAPSPTLQELAERVAIHKRQLQNT